jgi:beta-fructofuranosidase
VTLPSPTVPVLHVRPARGWLNDPNGTVRHGQRWHVFFQHNPARAQHGDIAWGHVSSPDLVRWTEHPVAFGPTPDGPDRGGCWSGAFLPWLDRPAVVYTGIVDGPERSTVCVRTALDDDLERWSPPVVVAREPVGAGVLAMRDPYPFVHDGQRFALLGAAMTDGSAAVLLFAAADPLAWTYEGVWASPASHPLLAEVAPADVWECPQLVRVGDDDVLVLSLQTDRRLEDVVHAVGRVATDPGTGLPRFSARSGGLLDLGPDFYAPQVVADEPGRPLLLGWVRQDDAPHDAPPDAVAGCLTLPRRLEAASGGGLAVLPHPALDALVAQEQRVAPDLLHAPFALPPQARVRIARAGAEVRLRAGAVEVPVDGDVELWLDGEVAEVFRPGTVARTVRSPGCAPWSLVGDLRGLEVSVAVAATGR